MLNRGIHMSKRKILILTDLRIIMMLLAAAAIVLFSCAGAYAVSEPASYDKTFDISKGDVKIGDGGNYLITGSTDKNRIVIQKSDETINVYFKDLTIDLKKTDRGDSREEAAVSLEKEAEAGIFIVGDTSLTGGNDHGSERNSGRAAIHVPDSAGLYLTVGEGRTLEAVGGEDGSDRGGAAVGSDENQNAGQLTITLEDNAKLTASAGYGGAGIGGGNNGSVESITISMGKGASIEAVSGEGGAGIGGGDDGGAGDITIKRTDDDRSSDQGISVRSTSSTDGGGAGIGGGSDGKLKSLTIDGIDRLECAGGKHAAGIGGGDHDGTGDGGNIEGTITVRNCASVKATGNDGGAGIGGGEDADISGGVLVENCASVTATGGKDAAGIGTGRDSNAGVDVVCGPVSVINSGVSASCADGSGAGIGCGSSAYVSEINIGGQKDITATGHGDGAGIGYAGGSLIQSTSGWTGNISISDVEGALKATAGDNGAGIGLGFVSLNEDGSNGNIRIAMAGGTLNAHASGTNNAGIGGGHSTDGKSNINRIEISGRGAIKAEGTSSGSAIGSGDDSNVENGIEIIGDTDSSKARTLSLDVTCAREEKSGTSCPLIGIDDPDDDEGDATDIVIKNAAVNVAMSKTDGRNCAIGIGGGQHGGGMENAGWIRKIVIDNCRISQTGSSGIGIGGNTRVSVGEININDTEYDGMAIGSMGYPMASFVQGDVTTRMKKIVISNSKVKAVARMDKANDSCSIPMAGIGGGNKTYVEEIVISDCPEVAAQGIDGGAGIGGGGYLYDSSFYNDFFTVNKRMGLQYGDSISIKNSNVKATGSEGLLREYIRQGIVVNGEGEIESVDYKTRSFCGCGAGIGGGGFQSFERVTIEDSEVNSRGAGTTNYGTWHLWEESFDSGSAGIGGGSMGSVSRIGIDASKVTATGSYGGAGIGSGGKDYQVQDALLKSFTGNIGNGEIDEISITNGSEVTSAGGFYGAGIGCGEKGTLNALVIDASTVNATGGEGAAGIGGGVNADLSEASISINGTEAGKTGVTARGGTGGAGIGTGVNFDKHSEDSDQDNITDKISISGVSEVYATGGCGAAGIGGGSGENSLLAEELHWDTGSNMPAGNVDEFVVSGEPLVVAVAGKNCISENNSGKTYKNAAADIGRGGSFTDSPESQKMEIKGGSVYSAAVPDTHSSWKNSCRTGASVNAMAPDADGKHLDTVSDRTEVYKVTLQVPGVYEYKKVSVSVTGDGAENKNGTPYYNDAQLYTDADGILSLWLREGGEDRTEATVMMDGTEFSFRGTSKSDHSGQLYLCSRIRLADDICKTYDGEPVEALLDSVQGDGDISFTYYKGDLSGKSAEELKQETALAEAPSDAGTYTVLAELSATETFSSAYDIGTCTILPAETAVISLTAEKADGNNVRLAAKVFGLVPGEKDCGTVTFSAVQGAGGNLIPESKRNVNVDADGVAEITVSQPAGTYTLTAAFLCSESKPNYKDSDPFRAEYSAAKVDVKISMSEIRAVYGDGTIRVPEAAVDVDEDPGAQKTQDLETVKNGLVYSLCPDPKSGTQEATVEYSSQSAGEPGTLTIKNAGLAVMKVSFPGSERLDPAEILVPVVISRRSVTAGPVVSSLLDGSWTAYSDKALTTYGRTEKDVYLKYDVNYSCGQKDELQGLMEAVPVSDSAAVGDHAVPLIRKQASRNYDVEAGPDAVVSVGLGMREVTVSCGSITFGQVPQPEVTVNGPYLPYEVSYHYTGTDNSGKEYNSAVAPYKAGEYKVKAVLSQRGNYAAVSSEAVSFSIGRADIEPSVSVNDHVYGRDLVISVSGNKGGGDVTYEFYRDEACTEKTTSEDGAATEGGEPSQTGTYYVRAYVAQTCNYNEAVTAAAWFEISRRTVEVKADDKNKECGQADPALTATVTGLVGEDTVAYSITREKGEESGVYRIIPTGDSVQGNYNVEYTDGLLTIGNRYTLYFDLGGGTLDGQTGRIEMDGLEYGQEITIPGPPKKDGYDFLYWKGSMYYPGDLYVVEGSHQFRAVWKEKADGVRTGDDGDRKGWTVLFCLSALSLTALTAVKLRRIRRGCK